MWAGGCVCGCASLCGIEINSGKSIYHFSKFYLEQDGQRTYKPNIEALSLNHPFRGKAINITYSEYVFVALIIHHAMPMHRIILPSVTCPVLPHFSTLSYKITGFSGQKCY